MIAASKPVVAVYSGHYLTVSMTFVHRQLLGVAAEFRPIVLAETTANVDLFPFSPVYVARRGAVGGRLAGLLRRALRVNRLLSPTQIVSFARILRREDVALIHAHFGPGGLDVLPLARALGIPLLVTFHGYDASSLLRDASYRRSLEQLFKMAHVITVSDLMRRRLIELGADPARTYTHYIGVPTEDFRFVVRRSISEKLVAGESIRFLQVSNFVEKKGHRYTVEAFARILARHPRAVLVLAGDGPLRSEIEKQVAALGIGHAVSFPGRVSKATAIPMMHEADVFLHHSVTGTDGDEEGIPTVVMEAMSTGLIVVTTRHAGIPEIVSDGDTGFLVPERDVTSYVTALERVLGSDASSVGRRASEFVGGRLDLRRQNARLVEIYRSLL